MTAIQKAREALEAAQKRAEALHDVLFEAREAIRVTLKPDTPAEIRAIFDKLHSAIYILRGDPLQMHMAAILAALDAETPATPADVGELVERLRKHETYAGDYMLIGEEDKTIRETVAALERVVRERDEARAERDENFAEARRVSSEYHELGKENLTNHQKARAAESKLAEALARLETVEAETRERIAAALDEEADLIPCAEDAMVTRSNARLVRANFSYEDAERLEAEEDAATIRNLEPRHD